MSCGPGSFQRLPGLFIVESLASPGKRERRGADEQGIYLDFPVLHCDRSLSVAFCRAVPAGSQTAKTRSGVCHVICNTGWTCRRSSGILRPRGEPCRTTRALCEWLANSVRRAGVFKPNLSETRRGRAK